MINIKVIRCGYFNSYFPTGISRDYPSYTLNNKVCYNKGNHISFRLVLKQEAGCYDI